MPATKVKTNRSQKWKPILLVQIYRMVRLNLPDTEICETLGFSRQAYWKWQKERPELRQAIKLAQKEYSDGDSFPNWIYRRLSPQLRGIWDKIKEWQEEENGVNKIEMMLDNAGKSVKQQLFLHALCVSSFNPSVAMKKLGLNKKELDGWINNDLNFAELVEEIKWHKGNFFESSLVRLVKEGNPSAVIFANKTFNSDRGFNPTHKVDVNVSGQVMVGVVDLSELMGDLSDAAKLEILEAIRVRDARSNPQLTAKPQTVIEAGEVLSQQIANVGVEE